MFTPLIECLRRGGRYSSCGCIAGPRVDFDLRQLIYEDLRLTVATVSASRYVCAYRVRCFEAVLAATYRLQEFA